MKNMVKRLMAAVLLLCMLVAVFVPASADAATATTGKRFNIMLVIDGSGSLVSKGSATDPEGMRYELIGELFGILEDDGHNIGAIVFSGTESKSANPTDKEMNEAIMLDTGLLSLDSIAPDGTNPKSYLERIIYDTNVNWSPSGGTDIGTALRRAQELLLEKQNENGLESVVFLFTDGNTAFAGNSVGAMQKSRANQDAAVAELNKNGIRVFGAFLNKGGQNSDEEMKRIVCNANGISTTSQEFQNSYVELQDASGISKAATSFLKFLGYISPDDNFEIYYDDIHDSFTIPGIGVEEMNIRLYSPFGEDLPNLDVKITQPDGTVINGVALKQSRTYRVYKLVKPAPGLWTIDIKVPEGNKIGYAYSPVVSLFIDSLVETNPAPQDLWVNKTADFTCLLSQAGNVITDPAAYQGYNCTLFIKNVVTGESVPYEIQPNAAGALTMSKLLDTYGSFEVTTVFTCDGIVVTSEAVPLDLTNRNPEAGYIPHMNLKCGLFQPKSTDVDLTQYFSDPEDGVNLDFKVTGTTCDSDAFHCQGNVITLDNKKVGESTITITATDSQGASVDATIQLKSTNVTLWFILAFVALVIIVAVVIIHKKRIEHTNAPNGELSVNFEMPYGGKTHHVSLDLNIPGADTTSKTTLYKLLQNALRDEERKVANGLYARDVTEFLTPMSSALGAVGVSATVKKRGKKDVGAIKVTNNKKTTVLYGSFADFYVGDNTFTLEFKPNEDDTPNPFGPNPFADNQNKKNAAPNPFDDLDSPFQVPAKKSSKASQPAAPVNDNPFDVPEKKEPKKNPLGSSKKSSGSDDFELF